MADSSSGVQSVKRALRILECFNQNQSNLSLSEISKTTGYYKSTVLRLADTLVQQGYLLRTAKAKKFRLGPKLFRLGKICSESFSLLEIAQPILEDLARESQESAGIYVIDGLERVCVARVQGPQFISASLEPGTRLPLHTGAAGKTLLAYSKESFVNKVIKEVSLPALTAKTITDPIILKEELAHIKKVGYASSDGESYLLAAGVAAPIFDEDGELACALSLSGPAIRFGKEDQPHLLSLLLSATKKLCSELGCQNN